MNRLLLGTVRGALRAVGYGLLGSLLAAVVGAVIYLDGRPDLSLWHTTRLDEEFTEDSPVATFADYLLLEKRLFAQLDQEIYAETEAGSQIDRYHRGSQSDPGRWPQNWNHSFEWSPARPTAAVLLLHGMSDSPYSVRSLAQRLHDAGAHVIGMRVPGHGTAPSGLVDVEWEDMAAAVRLAAKHLNTAVGNGPLYLVGYSNGGALAVQYTLAALTEVDLRVPNGLVLISPEIGITRLAALAVWQERLGHLLGLRKLAWNSILPEYDPFKYQSFALNAGKQAYLLTEEIQRRITALGVSGDLSRMPPVLAFQSVVDATVSAPALITNFFERLPPGDHELILFDINRYTDIEALLNKDPREQVAGLLRDSHESFNLSVLSNASEQSREVVLHRKPAGSGAPTVVPLGMHWPDDLYSLSHVSLPFPPTDPLYGGDAEPSPGIHLGDHALRGERGVLRISAADMLRLRWNPFYDYLEQRLLAFVGL